MKRANEFAQYVQPVLQQNCVKCHNEKYQGDFQLVEAKIRRDRNNIDILRANLDATLRLVNPDDPSRSELLSAGLVPHGGNRNAIFKGPNDPGYMILVTWIKKVRPPASGEAAQKSSNGGRPGFNTNESATGDGFAADRSSRPNSSPGFPMANSGSYPPLPGQNSGAPASGMQIPQSGSNVSNYDESADFVRSPGDNPQFPAPLTPPRTRPKAGAPGGSNSPEPLPPPRSNQTTKLVGPNTAIVPPAETMRELPGMDQALYPTPPSREATADPDAPPPPAAPKKKPKPIDPKLLEQMMKNRNGGTTPGGS